MKLVMGMVGCWCRPISILTDACKTRNEYRIMFRSTPTCPIPCMDADDALSSHKRNHIHMSWHYIHASRVATVLYIGPILLLLVEMSTHIEGELRFLLIAILYYKDG